MLFSNCWIDFFVKLVEVDESVSDKPVEKYAMRSPKRKSDITPRYMNWYSKSKNTVDSIVMDAKQLRSQSVPQDGIDHSKDDDEESGMFEVSVSNSYIEVWYYQELHYAPETFKMWN